MYCNLNAEIIIESFKSELKSESSFSSSTTTIIVSSADNKFLPVPVPVSVSVSVPVFYFFVGFFLVSRNRRFFALCRLPYFGARETIFSSKKKLIFFRRRSGQGRLSLFDITPANQVKSLENEIYTIFNLAINFWSSF